MIELHDIGTSRRDTTWAKTRHLLALPMFERAGTRGWVHRSLRLWIATSRRDVREVSTILLERHYLRRRATPPRTLTINYLAALDGGEGAGALAQIALLPSNLGPLRRELGLHACEVLTLTRLWRADDLTPDVAPDLTPEVVRRVVRRLAADWAERKSANLKTRPRLLVSYCDPAHGHDGATYTSAGAVSMGPTRGGKLLFAWALDPLLRESLRVYAQTLMQVPKA